MVVTATSYTVRSQSFRYWNILGYNNKKRTTMKRAQVFFGSLLALAAFVFVGCGVAAHVEKDPSASLKNYRTYAWIGEHNGTHKEGKSYQGLEEKNLKELVNKQLEKNGWREVKNNPDVLVDYDIMVENDVKNQSDPVYSYPTVRYFYNPFTRRINSVYYP